MTERYILRPTGHPSKLTGTALQNTLVASYAQLVAALGAPNAAGDGYKVSTEWELVDARMDTVVITVYDYKETDLYEQGLPTVAELRAAPELEWHIGAHKRQEAEDFLEWLRPKLGCPTARCTTTVHPGTSPRPFRCVLRASHTGEHDYGSAYRVHKEPQSAAEIYLGDAVYASFDGFQIRLRTGDENNSVIFLDPSVMEALKLFAARVMP